MERAKRCTDEDILARYPFLERRAPGQWIRTRPVTPVESTQDTKNKEKDENNNMFGARSPRNPNDHANDNDEDIFRRDREESARARPVLTLTGQPGDDVPVLTPRAAASALASRREPSSSAVLALRAAACTFDYGRGRETEALCSNTPEHR